MMVIRCARRARRQAGQATSHGLGGHTIRATSPLPAGGSAFAAGERQRCACGRRKAHSSISILPWTMSRVRRESLLPFDVVERCEPKAVQSRPICNSGRPDREGRLEGKRGRFSKVVRGWRQPPLPGSMRSGRGQEGCSSTSALMATPG